MLPELELTFSPAAGGIYIGQTGRQFNVLLREAMLLFHVAWLCVAIFRNVAQRFNGRFSVSEEANKRKNL